MTAERRLRRWLSFNAATSAASVGLCLAAARPLADLLAVPTPVVVGTAVLFAGWALVTGALARASTRALARYAPAVAVGDAAWTIGTAVVLVTGVVHAGSWWVLVPAAAVTGELAVLQWRNARALGHRSPALAAA
jgi:hypothetical protein